MASKIGSGIQDDELPFCVLQHAAARAGWDARRIGRDVFAVRNCVGDVQGWSPFPSAPLDALVLLVPEQGLPAQQLQTLCRNHNTVLELLLAMEDGTDFGLFKDTDADTVAWLRAALPCNGVVVGRVSFPSSHDIRATDLTAAVWDTWVTFTTPEGLSRVDVMVQESAVTISGMDELARAMGSVHGSLVTGSLVAQMLQTAEGRLQFMATPAALSALASWLRGPMGYSALLGMSVLIVNALRRDSINTIMAHLLPHAADVVWFLASDDVSSRTRGMDLYRIMNPTLLLLHSMCAVDPSAVVHHMVAHGCVVRLLAALEGRASPSGLLALPLDTMCRLYVVRLLTQVFLYDGDATVAAFITPRTVRVITDIMLNHEMVRDQRRSRGGGGDGGGQHQHQHHLDETDMMWGTAAALCAAHRRRNGILDPHKAGLAGACVRYLVSGSAVEVGRAHTLALLEIVSSTWDTQVRHAILHSCAPAAPTLEAAVDMLTRGVTSPTVHRTAMRFRNNLLLQQQQ